MNFGYETRIDGNSWGGIKEMKQLIDKIGISKKLLELAAKHKQQ